MKWDEAEQLCAEKIKNFDGARNPAVANAFLLLAEIFFGKSDQSDLGLVEKNNKILIATALCHYVLNLCKLGASTSNEDFSEPERKAEERIKTLQDALFLSMDIEVAKGHEIFHKVKKHQVYLQEIRNGLRVGLQSMPSISHDDLNEYEHYQKIQELYKVVADGLLTLVSEMLDDCVSLLGESPCHYAAIALGSLPRLEATPFSDLEWAILVEESDEEHKIYFRKLTQLLHSMVICFGETILPSMGIDCLGRFHDDVTPRGFAFDGALPQACKTPLGKRDKNGTIVYELIDTPEEIAKFQRLESFEVNPQLACVLRTVLIINRGEKALKLVRDYKLRLNEELDVLVTAKGDISPRKMREAVAIFELARDFDVFCPRLGDADQAGKFFDVKKEIYRLMDRLVASVGLYFNARAQSAWECLQWLHKENFLSEKGMRNLFVAVSIGTELRARAYTERGRQDDYLTCQAFDDLCEDSLDAVVGTLGLPPVETLYMYYFTVLPFLIHVFGSALNSPINSLDQMRDKDFYRDLPRYRALVSMRFRKYKEAKIELRKHLIAYPEDVDCLTDLSGVLRIEKKFKEAFLLYSKPLHNLLCSGNYMCNGKQLRSLNQIISWREYIEPLKASKNIIDHRIYLYNLGICYSDMQQYNKAIDCLECCVDLYREDPETLENVHGLARSLNVLSCVYWAVGNHKGVQCLQEALHLYANWRSFVTISAEAKIKLNLASWYERRGLLDREKEILEDIINQYWYTYGKRDNPEILRAKFLLGEVHLSDHCYHEAVKVLSSCLQSLVKPLEEPCSIKPSDVEPLLKVALTGARLSMLGSLDVSKSDLSKIVETSHDKQRVAVAMLYLAVFCLQLEQPKPAFELGEKCLSVLRGLYGETVSNHNLTLNLAILGKSCFASGKLETAKAYLKQALENHYEASKKGGYDLNVLKHYEVSVLTSLAKVYKAQKSFPEALKYYQKCLEIQSTIEDDKNVVKTLSNIGITYCLMGFLSKGVLFLEKAYDVVKIILKESEPQTVVDASFLSLLTHLLCTALTHIGRYDTANEIADESDQLMALVPKKNPIRQQ